MAAIIYGSDGRPVSGGGVQLDESGKIPSGYLPSTVMDYKGEWNASTNSPSLTDGTGSVGDLYRVSAAASRDLGSGSISFAVGDYVLYNGSATWEKVDTTDAVTSVAGKTGVVTLASSDVGLGNVTNDAQLKSADLDTDSTFAANSDSKIPSQKAVKTAVDSKQASLGFTPENVTNKDTDATFAANSDTKYPSQKAVKTALSDYVAKAQVGAASGVAGLDAGGKVPVAQLPNSIMEYQGLWSAASNNPSLADGVGNTGDVYRISTAGSQNLGSGTATYDVGDYVIYNASGIWEKADTTDAVSSVAGRTGAVTLTSTDVGLANVTNDAQLKAADLDTDSTFAANSDSKVPSQKAVKTALDSKQASLGFTAENVTNKDTDSTFAANSDTKYPSQKAVKTALDGKASATHIHAISDVTSLQTTLDGKALATHGHAIGEITNLQTTLDGKAAATHGHAIGEITNLQTTLDGKQASLGFTAENVANKDTDSTFAANSDTKYPSQKAVKTALGNYILASSIGVASGVAGLDSGGKVPVSQLPNSIMEYKGLWDASANTPSLADGTGNIGDVYRVSTGGTRNLGSGTATYDVGDYAIYNASGIWEKADTTDAVSSVAGRTGAVTLTSTDVGLGNVTNDAQLKAADLDTDSTFAANSDSKIPSQKAVKTALDAKQSSLGFTAENVANKDTDATFAANSDTKYPSQKAVKTALDGKASATHIHAIADVTSLQTTLDGKAAATHGHAIGEITNLQTTLDGKQASLGFTAENVANKDTDATFAANSDTKYPSQKAVKTALSNYVLASSIGVASGVAGLDAAGKVPVTQLPNSIMAYQGVWDASTNTPSLSDGGGGVGDVYRVSVAGSRNLGSGTVTYDIGDYVISNASSIWEKADTTDAVSSVAGRTGAVTLTSTDVGLANVTNDAQLKAADLDTDSTFAANSDSKIPSQKAVKTALDGKQASLGFTAENVANKDTDSTFAANSDTKYPSQKAVKTALDGKQASLGFTAEDVANKDTDATFAANSDTKYPSQKAVKTAVDLKANISSPTFTGTPAAPTPAINTSTTQIATTEFVASQGYFKSAGIDTDSTFAANSDVKVPSQKAVKTALDGKQASLGFTAENVDNKDTDATFAANSDTKYPSQKAVKTALANYILATSIGVASGVASLDSGGKVPVSQLPNSIMEYKGTWDASTNTPSLADGGGSPGDVYRVSVAGSRDLGSGSISYAVSDYVISNASSIWEKADTTDAVSSVAGRTGAVTLTSSDVGLGNVSNATQIPLSYLDTDSTFAANSDAKVPSQKAVKTAMDLKANLASPTFTGTPLAPTPAINTSTTQIATTEFVASQGYLKSAAAASSYQPLNANLTAIATTVATTNDLLQYKSGAWTNRTPAQLKTDLALSSTDVGLGNVSNATQIPLSYLDTDASLSANSDAKVPSQKAIKSYVDSVAGVSVTVIDGGAANANYVFKPILDGGIAAFGPLGTASGITSYLTANSVNGGTA